MRVVISTLFLISNLFAVELIHYDFGQDIAYKRGQDVNEYWKLRVVDLNVPEVKVEANFAVINYNKILYDLEALKLSRVADNKLIKEQDKQLNDLQRKAKFERAMKITGIVLGVVGGFALGVGVTYGVMKLRR